MNGALWLPTRWKYIIRETGEPRLRDSTQDEECNGRVDSRISFDVLAFGSPERAITPVSHRGRD